MGVLTPDDSPGRNLILGVLSSDLVKHVISSIQILTAEARSHGAGDVILWSLNRWILPKLESYLAVWGSS